MTCAENRYCATPVAFSSASYFAPAGAGIAKGLAPWLNRPTAVDVSPRLRRDRTVAKQCVSAPFAWSLQDLSTLTGRSEEQTSELQQLLRISNAVFLLKKKNIK